MITRKGSFGGRLIPYHDLHRINGNKPATRPSSFLAALINSSANNNADRVIGASLSQTFIVPAAGPAQVLFFDLRFLSNTPASFVSFGVVPFGGLALSQSGTVLADYVLDIDPNSAASAHVNFNAAAGGFTGSTPWLTSSFDLSTLLGQQVTLTAYVTRAPEFNGNESRLLVDNVRLADAVPEPATMALLFGGGVLALAVAGVRRRRRAPASF